MSNSNWLSVFGRDYSAPDPCVENLYGVCFDGVSSYAVNSSGILGPDPASGNTKKMWVSVWVKDMSTAATDAGETIFSQGISGNTTNDWFRMTYRPQASGGAARNQIELEWRSNFASGQPAPQNSRAREFYRLHSSNTSITGATSDTDYWIDGNANINTNADGFVHLLWIMDLPKAGDPINTGTTDFALYWNGQLMTATHAQNMTGTSQVTNLGAADLGIGRDAAQGGAYWKGMLDELFVVSRDQSGPFMTEFGLTTNQDIADYFWNTGCPGDLGNDSRWNFNWWRFENNWNARSGTNAWSPINSPSFGSFPNGCSFSSAALSCTENTLIKAIWHPSWPKTTSSSADVESHISSNFVVGANNQSWNTVQAAGNMSWLAIGMSVNGTPTSTSDVYQGTDYWIRMYAYDGDGNLQSTPSVNGGTSAPNLLLLEEKDAVTGALTGNNVTFQCVEDGFAVQSAYYNFIFKARVISQSGYGTSTPDTASNSGGPSSGSTWCVSWSSVTPLVTCTSAVNLETENEYRDGFQWPSSNPNTGGGGAIGN